ncbi:MAG: MFS transporter [bacterium]|nr:MFS transporter [bacterium]
MLKIKRTLNYYKKILKAINRNAYFYLLGNLFSGFGFSAFTLLFNIYLKSLNIGESKIGNLLSTGTFTTALLILPAAYIVKRTDVKKFFIISPILTVTGYFLAIQSSTFQLRMLGFILAGISAAFTSVISGPFIMSVSDSVTRTFLFSLNQATMLTAGISGNLVSGFLPNIIKRFGFSEVKSLKYAIFFHLLFVIISLFFFSKIKVKRIYNSTFKDKVKFNTDLKILFYLVMPPLIIGLGAGMTIPFLNLYFKTIFHLSPSTIGIIFSIAQLLTILGSLLSPLLAKKFGLINTIIITQIVSIPFLFILGFSYFFPLVLISFFLRNALMNMGSPLSLNFSLEVVDPEDRSFTSGLLSLAWLASWGLTANFGGYFIEKTGYRIPFTFTIICYFTSSLLYFILLRPLEKRIRTSK